MVAGRSGLVAVVFGRFWAALASEVVKDGVDGAGGGWGWVRVGSGWGRRQVSGGRGGGTVHV